MSTVNVLVSGVTATSARIAAKVTGALDIRVAVADNADLTSPTYHGPTTTANNAGIVDVTGLSPDTDYWYGIEDNGVLDATPEKVGTFTTHPEVGAQASYTVLCWGDAGQTPEFPGSGSAVVPSLRLSDSTTFDDMRAHSSNPLWALCLGDWGYPDPGSGVHVPDSTQATYRAIYDDNLIQPRQDAFARAMAWDYIWDDHDFGPNNSDRNSPGRDNACLVYRQRFPHYPLGAGTGAQPIYHAYTVGRVLWVVLDTRADRSPNTDPDDDAKTMLGGAQKAWLRALLESAAAEAMVLVTPTPWLGTTDDGWSGGFTTERNELQQMLEDTGWADRMVMVQADQHAHAISSGPGNPHGSWPIYQFAPIDADPSGASGSQYDIGFNAQRRQYGTIEVQDDGDTLRIIGSGWIESTLWRSHTLTLDLTPPAPGTPPPVSDAVPRTSVTWLACTLADGRIIAELPDIQAPISRVLGAYTSTSANLPIPLSGPGHIPIAIIEAATELAQTMLVPVVNDIPIYGGIPLPRESGTDPTMTLGLMSLEGYLDNRKVRDHEWTQRDEASVIVAGLVGDAEAIDGVGQGLNLVIDAPATGTLRDRTYLATDRKSVYEALQELMAVIDGPEWTIDLDWTDSSQTAVAKIFRVRKRIGTAAATPTAVFETTASSVFSSQGSSEAKYSYKEDKAGGLYANWVQAYSSGEGEDQPQSDPAIDAGALAAGAVIWEKHFQPSTSITDKAVLDSHAQAELARRKNGSKAYRIETRWDSYPRYGLDWRIGDDVAWHLAGHRHPAGITGQGRVIGFELDVQAGLIKPILLEDDDG